MSAESSETKADGCEQPSFSEEEFKRQRAMLVLPERICFLVDTCGEMTAAWEDGVSRLEAIKSAIRVIFKRKSNLSSKHKYMIATFNQIGDIRMCCNFTNRVSELDAALEGIAADISAPTESTLDLTALLDSLETLLCSKRHELSPTAAICTAAEFVNRCVLVYGRSSEVPTYSHEPHILRDPIFYLDILYVHHRSSEPGTRCQEIFDVLCEAQRECPEGTGEFPKSSYIIESHPSQLKFLPAIALMLSHPVQRGELYGENGMISKIDPSEAYINSIRSRCPSVPPPVPLQSSSSSISPSAPSATRDNSMAYYSGNATGRFDEASGQQPQAGSSTKPSSSSVVNFSAIKNIFGAKK